MPLFGRYCLRFTVLYSSGQALATRAQLRKAGSLNLITLCPWQCLGDALARAVICAATAGACSRRVTATRTHRTDPARSTSGVESACRSRQANELTSPRALTKRTTSSGKPRVRATETAHAPVRNTLACCRPPVGVARYR
ncbi:hypothetical protein EIP99_18880 [Xanthomonas campestris pv. raphani]